MPLDAAELEALQTALSTGTYAENENIKALSGLGLRIRTEAEDTTHLEGYHTSKLGEVKGQFEAESIAALKEATGIEPKDKEGYQEYLKRTAGGLKSELTRLQGAKTGTEADKQRIEELQNLLATKDTETETKLGELRGQFAQKEISNTIASGINKLLPTLKKVDFLEDVVEARKQKFLAAYTPELDSEGNTVYKNKEGKVELGADYKPATTDFLLGKTFADLVDTGKQQGGAGSGNSGPGAGGSGSGTISLPAEVKTKGEAADWLKNNAKSLGLTVGTKEYNEAYKNLEKDLPLR